MPHLITRFVLNRLLQKAALAKIPRSGEEVHSVDCYVIYVRGPNENWTLLVRRVDRTGLKGLYWDEKGRKDGYTITWKRFDDENCRLDITHFFRQYDLRYFGLASYLLRAATGYHRIAIALDRTGQFLFNRRPLIRSERIDVLKTVVELYLDRRNFEFDHVTLMSVLHSRRWLFHPDRDRQLAYVKLLLEGLQASGDIKQTGPRYVITGNATNTIAQAETEDRKHQDNIQSQTHMKWLTLVLILVGIFQGIQLMR